MTDSPWGVSKFYSQIFSHTNVNEALPTFPFIPLAI